MLQGRKTTLALALAATLVLSGCVGTGEGDSLDFLGSSDDAETGEVRVVIDATGVEESDLSHLGMQLDGVFLHEASTPLPDGYHELNLQSEHADVVNDGSSVSSVVANGSVQVGTYDQLRLQVDGVETQKASASGGHDHGDGDGHDHGDGGHDSASEANATSLPGADVPINVTFPVEPDRSHQIKVTIDVAASTAGEEFTPVLDVAVTADGEELAEATLSADGTTNQVETPPPAARMTVFAPNGDKVYEPSFTVEQGVFANDKASAFAPGAEVRFSGTESEATAEGATITSYEWDFDDGTTATGQTATHAFDQVGVFEVEMTVTDSNDVSATHTVRVVVSGWTTELVSTSFEEEGEWSASSTDTSTTTWARNGEPRTGETSWQVSAHVQSTCEEAGAPSAETCPATYTPRSNATLTSPEIEIPEDWSGAGVQVFIMGGSESGWDFLTVSYTTGNNTTKLGEFSGDQPGWKGIGSQSELDGAIGKTVQFEFRFTSDTFTQEGPGWSVDDFTIGGVDSEVHKAHLFEELGGHGGHDHSH